MAAVRPAARSNPSAAIRRAIDLVVDTFAICYPARRYQSAWIGIAVHSAQSVVVGAVVLALVL